MTASDVLLFAFMHNYCSEEAVLLTTLAKSWKPESLNFSLEKKDGFSGFYFYQPHLIFSFLGASPDKAHQTPEKQRKETLQTRHTLL